MNWNEKDDAEISVQQGRQEKQRFFFFFELEQGKHKRIELIKEI